MEFPLVIFEIQNKFKHGVPTKILDYIEDKTKHRYKVSRLKIKNAKYLQQIKREIDTNDKVNLILVPYRSCLESNKGMTKLVKSIKYNFSYRINPIFIIDQELKHNLEGGEDELGVEIYQVDLKHPDTISEKLTSDFLPPPSKRVRIVYLSLGLMSIWGIKLLL